MTVQVDVLEVGDCEYVHAPFVGWRESERAALSTGHQYLYFLVDFCLSSTVLLQLFLQRGQFIGNGALVCLRFRFNTSRFMISNTFFRNSYLVENNCIVVGNGNFLIVADFFGLQ